MHAKHFINIKNKRLNGKFVDHLICDQFQGYSEKYTGSNLASQFDTVKIECVDGELISDEF